VFAQNTKSIQRNTNYYIVNKDFFSSPSLPGEDDNFPNPFLTVSIIIEEYKYLGKNFFLLIFG